MTPFLIPILAIALMLLGLVAGKGLLRLLRAISFQVLLAALFLPVLWYLVKG